MCREKVTCRQCDLLIKELGVYRKRHDEERRQILTQTGAKKLLRLKIRDMAQELQKLEEQLQDEVNYSSTLSETIKELGD